MWSPKLNTTTHPKICFGDFTLTGTQLLWKGDPQPIGEIEFRILWLLVENHGRVVTKDDIRKAIWENKSRDKSLLHTHISHLRGILKEGRHPRIIVNHRDEGYSFESDISENDENNSCGNDLSNGSTNIYELAPVGGAIALDSPFYVVRPADKEFLTAIRRRDSIVLVKGARQMGKTSMLARGLQEARVNGATVALLDFQRLNNSHFDSLDGFYRTISDLLVDELDLDVSPQNIWATGRGPNIAFSRFIEREVLGRIHTPLVLGLDEVDRLFTKPYDIEVFGLFRTWHNDRAGSPLKPWGRLTLAISYSTEGYLKFDEGLHQSPLNVGMRFTLEVFTRDQLIDLIRKYGFPLRSEADIDAFYRYLGGQPYLTSKGLREMAARRWKLSELQLQAEQDYGPFGDHLRHIVIVLNRKPSLWEAIGEVLKGNPCPSTEAFYSLKSAGLVIGDTPSNARILCELYRNYLSGRLRQLTPIL